MWFSKYKKLSLVIKDKFGTKTIFTRKCLKSVKPSTLFSDLIAIIESDFPVVILEDDVSYFRIKREDIMDWWITNEIY